LSGWTAAGIKVFAGVISHLIVSMFYIRIGFQISTGNKGVEQLSANFFSKCGIALFLFPLILTLLCMTGCLEKSPEASVMPSKMQQGQLAISHMQMDFDAELRSDLFCVRGNIMLPGNSSLAYLMLNATLYMGEREQFSTKYLLMQIEPNRDYSFEIAKNVKIPAGEYDCTLEANGPQGILAKERRRISLVKTAQEPIFWQVPWPVDLDADEKAIEENVHAAANKKSPVAKVGKKNASAGAKPSAQDSSISALTSTMLKDGKPRFMGSTTSKKYHRLDCRYALKIKKENCIYFQSIKEAEGQGYLPCKVCNP
jgi:hypothetical protein